MLYDCLHLFFVESTYPPNWDQMLPKQDSLAVVLQSGREQKKVESAFQTAFQATCGRQANIHKVGRTDKRFLILMYLTMFARKDFCCAEIHTCVLMIPDSNKMFNSGLMVTKTGILDHISSVS